MTGAAKRREQRLELRLTPEAKAMLKRAQRQEKSIGAFVLDKSLKAAAETLAERCSFALSAKQYDAFVAALDATPKSRPRLERLFCEPSALESAVLVRYHQVDSLVGSVRRHLAETAI